MKWFICINGNSPMHRSMSKAAVLSAIKNTTLEPHLVYAGERDDYANWMLSKGVRVFYRTLSYIDELRRCDKEQRAIGSGAFLRTELPCLIKSLGYEDKYVLYTDCDVMFLKDPPVDIKPEYFACGPEFDQKNDSHCNTGVMYMNIHSLYYTYDRFKQYIIEHIDKEQGYDQAMFNGFYRDMWGHLPIELNWKPYWGYNENAIIVHWHGPKPDHISQMKSIPNPESFRVLYDLWQGDTGSYDKYLKIYYGDFLCFA